MTEIRKLSSREKSINWSSARHWLAAEALRFGWTDYKVEENLETKTIYGQLRKIKGEIPTEDCRVFVERKSAFHFEIKALNGTPSIVIRKDLPGEGKGDNSYRVYHEFVFDADAIYPLGKVLAATTREEAEAAAWFDKVKSRNYKMSWWYSFLHSELETYRENPVKFRDLKALMNGVGAYDKHGGRKSGGARKHHTGPAKQEKAGLAKQEKANPEPAVPDYGPVAAKLMAKMGYQNGMGLGKAGDGITDPIVAKANQNRKGLGIE